MSNIPRKTSNMTVPIVTGLVSIWVRPANKAVITYLSIYLSVLHFTLNDGGASKQAVWVLLEYSGCELKGVCSGQFLIITIASVNQAGRICLFLETNELNAESSTYVTAQSSFDLTDLP